MYTSGNYQGWHSASEKPVPNRGDYPLSEKSKGKRRERSVQYDDSAPLPYLQTTPTPSSSPSRQDEEAGTLSVGVDVPLRVHQSATAPAFAAMWKSSPRFAEGYAPSLPPVPQSPRGQRPQQSSTDPATFKLPPAPSTDKPRISGPLFPSVTNVRMHVERDAAQPRPVFDFEMRFRVTLTEREMP